MKKIGVVLFLFVFLFGAVAFAEAATTSGTFKLAHSESETEDIIATPYTVLTGLFKDIVEAETGGRFKIEVFPAKQLGDSTEVMDQAARGIIQLTTSQNAGHLASLYPAVQMVEIPYAFRNVEVARDVLNGEYGDKFADKMAEKTGLRILAWVPTAYRNFANNVKEIHKPEDLKGMKIRVMPAPMYIEMIKAFGASPTPINWGELYTALQTGVVEGHEQPPYVMLLGGMTEVTKYYTVDQHTINAFAFSINEKVWQSLTPEDQHIFKYAAREAGLAMAGLIRAKELLDMKRIEDAGVKITYLSGAEVQAFKDIAQPAVLNELKKSLDPSEVDEFLEAVKASEKKLGWSE